MVVQDLLYLLFIWSLEGIPGGNLWHFGYHLMHHKRVTSLCAALF